MTERDAIERRLSAVERAVSGGEEDLSGIATASERDERLSAVEERLDAIDERVTELEAATQALRGYVGNVRSVNRDVERRAEAALAAVDRLEGVADPGDGRPVESASSADVRDGGTTADTADAGAPDGRLDGRRPRAGTPADGSGSDSAASPAGSPRRSESPVEDLDTGPAMPVPGAENGTHAGGGERDSGSGDRSNGDDGSTSDDRSNGDGVFDRVRDAL